MRVSLRGRSTMRAGEFRQTLLGDHGTRIETVGPPRPANPHRIIGSRDHRGINLRPFALIDAVRWGYDNLRSLQTLKGASVRPRERHGAQANLSTVDCFCARPNGDLQRQRRHARCPSSRLRHGLCFDVRHEVDRG